MIAGKAIPKAERQRAPNKEMNKPSLGIDIASTTENLFHIMNKKMLEGFIKMVSIQMYFVLSKNFFSNFIKIV